MTLIDQILVGGGLFIGACILHLSFLALIVSVMRRAEDITWISTTLLFMILAVSHIVHIGLWAVTLQWTGAFTNIEDALYFALTSYTTVGYGDVTLGPDSRILGTLSAFAGILTFGMSTALLVALFSQVIGRD